MSDAACVKQAQAGDRMAFRTLVLEHSEPMQRLALRLTGSEAAAQDVVQDAWIKAHRNLDRFDGRARFGTWIHRITVNTALDHMRKNKSRQRFEVEVTGEELPAVVASESCPAEREDLITRTMAALQKLTDMERSAFTLRHFEGHSIREICELLGIRNSACKQAIFRAVHKMREHMEALA
ncbi:MAG: RNA polymerase sigma factor [Lysobacterales bacterium]